MKRSLFAFAVLVFVALGVWYSVLRQGPGATEVHEIAPWPKALGSMDAPTIEPGILTGQILLADGVTPCSEALVELLQGDQVRWAWTDERGNFHLTNLQATNKQRLIVLVAEHMPQSFEVAIDGLAPTQVSWTLGAKTQPLTALPEVTWGDLVGRVRAGLPGLLPNRSLENFEVWIVPAGDSDPMLALGERRAPVDKGGLFRSKGMLSGRYTAKVLPQWAHGGSWPVLGEADFQLTEEGLAQDLTIRLVEGRVTGVLRDLEGLPVPGAMLVLRSHGTDQARVWPPIRSQDDGTFALVDLPPGTYAVELVAGEARHQRQVTVSAGASETLHFGPISPRAPVSE